MTSASFSRPGAIDLSSLAAAAPPAQAAGGSYVMDITEADFESLVSRSMQYPVILEITMTAAPETHGVDQTLVRLANAAGGRWLLARVDAQKTPGIAQALGVQAVPTVIALVAGQIAPLFQGTRDEAEIMAVIDEVMRIAVQNGLTGRAQPISDSTDDTSASVNDPRFAKADEALSKGDFVGAAKEFEKLVNANPRDVEAIAGKAQAELLSRTVDADVDAVLAAAQAAPTDVDAQLAAADVEVIRGDAEEAFTRLIALIRELPSAEREPIRERLIDLFTTMDPADPIVLKARRELSSVLF